MLDIVGVLNEESNYSKTCKYWKYLKAKLKKENNQLVSATTQLKLKAADGKKYNTDTLDSSGVIELAKQFPNNRAAEFLDWFLYSDTSLDGQSKKKAYSLFESNLNKRLKKNKMVEHPLTPIHLNKKIGFTTTSVTESKCFFNHVGCWFQLL